MAGAYNPSSPETLGLEWLVTDPVSTVVLDSAAKGYGLILPGATDKRSQELAVYADVVSGIAVVGCQVLSAPYVEGIPQTLTTIYAGTDTGAEFTSPANGGNAWLTQAGGAASYASVSPGVDDSTYLRNVNQVEGPTPARLMMRGANAQTVLAGRRILDVEIRCRVKSTLATAPTFAGCLNLAGIDYPAQSVVIPTGQGYNDLSLGKWSVDPSTGLPWTLPAINNLVVAGATDEFGLLARWDARYTTSYSDTIRISKVWLVVRCQPEDRCGYASGQVSATGWQTWTSKSVPNLLTKQDSNLDSDTAALGTWVADANTTATNDTDDPGGAWTRSLKMAATASGTFGAKSGYYPCIAGKTYAFRCFAKVTSGRSTVCSIEFYDANGTLLQTSSSSGDTGTGSYKAIGMTAAVTAPTGATQMKVHIVTTATAGAQTCFATGMFLGLAQSAMVFVRDTSPGGAAPTKVDGGAETSSIAHPTDELRIFRRISGPGIVSLPSIGPGASAVGMPLGLYSYRPKLQDAAGALLTLGVTSNDCTAVVTTSLHNWDAANGPIASLSQPYAARVTGLVNTGNTIQDEKTLPVATYLAVRLVVAGEVDEPDADLVLKVKKRADNSQVGGDIHIAPTDLEQIIPPGGSIATRTTPQVFVVEIPTPAANTSAQHYIEASSSATPGSGWVLYAFDTMGYLSDSVNVDTITFSAGVDAWTSPSDGGELTRRNGLITLQTKPTAPSGVTATVVGNTVRIDRSATSIGDTFEAAEIWRSDDTRFGYQQVADLAAEATTSWVDTEVERGVAATYKVRLRRTDGSLSDFSDETTPVTVDPSSGARFLLGSNEMPGTTVSAQLVGETDLTFQPPAQTQIREFFMRDGAVAFMPLEDPLDEFEFTVSLYLEGGTPTGFLTAPPVSGRAAFRDLEALCRAALSYVCIRDWDGNRWLANVTASDLVITDDGEYRATLHVRELTRTPSTPTA